MRKRKQTELMSFKACVVETTTYDSGSGKLHHATLDSLPGQTKRQAQLFSTDPVFKAGDIHLVTFSLRIGRSKRRVKEQTQAEVEAERAAAIKDALEKLEASQTIN